jgi:hypothetical protein
MLRGSLKKISSSMIVLVSGKSLHKAIAGFYDKWYKAQTHWVYLACHGTDTGKCHAVKEKFEEKNQMVTGWPAKSKM